MAEDASSRVRHNADLGITTVPTKVMEKVAAHAVREAGGVWGFDAAMRDDGERALDLAVDGRTATATVRLTVEYGFAVDAVADRVRTELIDTLRNHFGLEVTAIDIIVEDVHIAEVRPDNPAVTPAALGSTFKLVNRHSGKVLSVEGGSMANGANIVQAADTGAATQRWRLLSTDDYTVVVNAGSGKALDVPAWSTTAGVQLVQWTTNSDENQQWTVTTFGGYVTLASRHSGLLVDVHAFATHDGAAVTQWQFNGGGSQQWQIVAAPDEFHA